MAFQFGAGDGDDLPETHEINVTPFIDVILVLLIVFMVAAPLATVDMPVHLPVASGPRQPPPEHPAVLTLQADGTLFLGETPVAADGMIRALDQATGGDHTARVFVRGDGAVPYAQVMTLLSRLRRSGYGQVALVGLESASTP